MKSLLKRVLISGYCRGLIPARVVSFVFRHIDLKSA